ncbi:tail fiber protein [Pedobacter ginsengisoli]|uniref:tail fiber protein n=1 Tax=Pedobacter ginsengisoli TaxID=363852 RepID=UPI00254A6C66|nr:tail fiber protein [Pedobacter ginsengisoli]
MKLTSISKCLVGLALIVTAHLETQAQNLLDMTGWTVGSGTSGIFNIAGSSTESVREWGTGPDGKNVVVWKAIPSGNSSNDGGWNTQTFPVIHTNKYRYTIWLKKSNSANGSSYFGCGTISTLAGVTSSNPYFWAGDLPLLNKWYLLVAYIHGSNDTSTVHEGGIYDGATGSKVRSIADFKFLPTAVSNYHRTFLNNDTALNDRQFFYSPRVDVVNGNEPTLAALLGLQPGYDNQAYFSGKVGIKTTVPGDYDLAVKGKVRAQEVKVEMANWPDFVFAKDYALPMLQETEKHIKEKGHLPGISSAAEVEKNGIELGDINKKLLQKIEELTLYIIQLNKRVTELEGIKSSN